MQTNTDATKTLNDLIKDSGLTWKQLAERLGVSESTIGLWAHKNPERRKVPSLEKAIALSVELGVDIKSLARSMDIPNKNTPNVKEEIDREDFREQFREQGRWLLPKSQNPRFREQIEPCPEEFREQPATGLLMEEGLKLKVKGKFWRLTHSKHRTPIPDSLGWFDVKTIHQKTYLYLRWREGKTQRSKCLGKIEPL
jgi:transcriptional regulator with XRE-family HTH domain